MAASPPDPDRSEPDPEHRMPGWVKAFLIAGIVVVLVAVTALLLTDGSHGPGRHLPGGSDGEVEAPGGHEPPPGVDH